MVPDKTIHKACRTQNTKFSIYKQNLLEKFFIFTIYQKYTLALIYYVVHHFTVFHHSFVMFLLYMYVCRLFLSNIEKYPFNSIYNASQKKENP